MTNQVHLLVTPRRSMAVAKLMQSVGRRYVRYINHEYPRSGTLWEGRYKARAVDAERYLLTCYRYIETNPVRAAVVNDPRDYVWSSYRRNAWGEVEALLIEHPEYTQLGDSAESRRAAYRELMPVDAASLKEIRESANQCRVLGSERFQQEIEAVLQRRVRPAKPGRKKRDSNVDTREAQHEL
jgi:putative transposase